MIFGHVLCWPLWPSRGWYCHGKESQLYEAFLRTLGNISESCLDIVYMYSSEYGTVASLKNCQYQKHESKWILSEMLKSRQNPRTSVVFKSSFGVNEWLIICTWDDIKRVNDHEFICTSGINEFPITPSCGVSIYGRGCGSSALEKGVMYGSRRLREG